MKNKSIGIILGSVVGVLLIAAMFINLDNNVDPHEPNVSVIEKYKKALEGDTKSIVYIWSETCVFCIENKPTIEQLSKEFDIISINLTQLYEDSKDDYNYFLTSNDYLKNEEWGTPTMLIVSNNKVIDALEGKRPIEDVRKFLANNGLSDDKAEPYEPKTTIIKDYKKALEDTSKSIVYIWSETCVFCIENKPTIEQLNKEFDIISINLTQLYEDSKDDYNYFLTSNDYLKNEEWGTPTMLIVSNNKVIDDLAGKRPIEDVRKFFTSNGL